MSGFQKLLKSQRAIIAAIIILFLLALLTITILSKSSNQQAIGEDQILIQKGSSTIIVNKNGLIEYRSKDSVVYKTWSQARINTFFTNMQNKAREYLQSGSQPCPNCYKVTLYIDGKLVEIYLEEEDELIEEIIDDVGSQDSPSNLSDFFNDEQDQDENAEEQSDEQDGSITPTPTPIGSQGQDNEDQEQPSQQENYPPVEVDCSTWSGDITERAIITNTFCTNTN